MTARFTDVLGGIGALHHITGALGTAPRSGSECCIVVSRIAGYSSRGNSEDVRIVSAWLAQVNGRLTPRTKESPDIRIDAQVKTTDWGIDSHVGGMI